MSVFLLNPPVKKVIEKRYDSPDFPSIGLAYLSRSLKKADISFKVLDAKYDRINFENVVKKIILDKPKILGFTAFTCDMSSVNRIATEIKKELKITTIIGGCHVTSLPKETLKEFPAIDFVLVGEGEESFTCFCKEILHGIPELQKINGLAYRKGDVIKLQPKSGYLKDLDAFSPPLWEVYSSAKEYLILTSRGCPYSCIFCSNPNGRNVRERSVESVLDEMLWLMKNTPVKKFTFTDEIFGIHKQRTVDLLEGMIRIGVPGKVEWMTQTHVNVATFDMFKLMKKAGCVSCGLGIETGDENILKNIQKRVSFEDFFAVRDYAKKAELPIEGYFILGHPNETKSSVHATIKMAIKLNPDYPVIGIMSPYPGTKVRQMALANRGGYRLRSNNWDDYNKQIGNALEFTNISREYLELAQLTGYLLVYILNFRFIDLMKFIAKYYWEGFCFFSNLFFKKRKKNV